jgi:glycosyltransferase involved in cell wall biosynthesis
LRVLFLTRKWPPAVGGMETYSAELTRELAPETDLTVHALPGRPDGGAPGAAGILSYTARAAWRILTGRRHQVIHGADMAIWPLVLLARLRSPRASVILSAHGTDVSFAERSGIAPGFYRNYMRLGAVLLRCAVVLANSRATAERARGLGFGNVEVIALGTRKLAADGPPEVPGRFVLFAGRLTRRKGCAWFIREVLPLLPPDITMRVAGTVWDSDERAALMADGVTYLGALDQVRLGAQMAEALCVVAPNIPAGRGHFEGFGLIAVEAAMAGGVVIASRMDGFLDSVLDGETGFLVTPRSAPDWAARITELVGWSGEGRRNFVSRSQARARRHFTWERVARDTLVAYRAACMRNADHGERES